MTTMSYFHELKQKCPSHIGDIHAYWLSSVSIFDPHQFWFAPSLAVQP